MRFIPPGQQWKKRFYLDRVVRATAPVIDRRKLWKPEVDMKKIVLNSRLVPAEDRPRVKALLSPWTAMVQWEWQPSERIVLRIPDGSARTLSSGGGWIDATPLLVAIFDRRLRAQLSVAP